MAHAAARPAMGLRALAFGAAIGVIAVMAVMGRDRKLEDIGLGYDTTARYERSADGGDFHCHSIADAPNCLQSSRERAPSRRLIWLGTSQLHGVNAYHPGDHTAPALVYETLRREGTDVLTFSLPNFNPQEQAVFFEYLRVRVQINGLVLPLVFDTMR